MKRLTPIIALAALVIAGATALLLTSVARADVTIIDNGGGNVVGQSIVNVPGRQGGPCNVPNTNPPTFVTLTPANPNLIPNYCVGPAGTGVAAGGYDFPGVRAWKLVYTVGNARAGGGLGTSALPDSVIASVGLYPPGGGHNSETCDSCRIYVQTNRSVSGQITLSISGGGLMIHGIGPNQGLISTYRVIAYPTQAAANADPTRDGFGSVFFGEVVLEAGAIDGVPLNVPPQRLTRGGFTNNDWNFQAGDGPSNTYVSRPSTDGVNTGTITKTVLVPNANTAVVAVFADPASMQRQAAVPGYSPFGLVLLALGLLGSGFWVIRSRQRVETA